MFCVYCRSVDFQQQHPIPQYCFCNSTCSSFITPNHRLSFSYSSQSSHSPQPSFQSPHSASSTLNPPNFPNTVSTQLPQHFPSPPFSPPPRPLPTTQQEVWRLVGDLEQVGERAGNQRGTSFQGGLIYEGICWNFKGPRFSRTGCVEPQIKGKKV